MSERQIIDELIVVAEDLAERAKQLIKEGSAKKLTVKHEDKTILEIPLTAGVFGALVAPYLAALGIFSALLTKCTIAIEDV